jgi:hypothetical protein
MSETRPKENAAKAGTLAADRWIKEFTDLIGRVPLNEIPVEPIPNLLLQISALGGCLAAKVIIHLQKNKTATAAFN